MKNKLLIPLLSLCILASFGALIVHAQTPQGSGGTPAPATPQGSGGTPVHVSIKNPFAVCGASGCSLLDLINSIITGIVLPIGGVLIVLAFIWTGFQFVMAQGDTRKIATARTMLLYSALGAVIILGATAISQLVKGTLDQFQTLK